MSKLQQNNFPRTISDQDFKRHLHFSVHAWETRYHFSAKSCSFIKDVTKCHLQITV